MEFLPSFLRRHLAGKPVVAFAKFQLLISYPDLSRQNRVRSGYEISRLFSQAKQKGKHAQSSSNQHRQFSFSASLGVMQHLNSQEGRQAFWQLTVHTLRFLYLDVIFFLLVNVLATVFFFFTCFLITLFFLAYPVSSCFSSFFATFLGTA